MRRGSHVTARTLCVHLLGYTHNQRSASTVFRRRPARNKAIRHVLSLHCLDGQTRPSPDGPGFLGQARLPSGWATASDNRVALSVRLWLVLLVATIVVWLIWQHRAHANLRALGTELEYSPGWAVGFWLIPIANLWKPFQVNRELWKASGDVNDWRSQRTWPVLGWWWASWISAGVLGRVAAAARESAETPMEIRSADIVDLLSTAVVVASAVLAILLVRSVIERQDRLAAAVPHVPTPPPPPPRPDASA